jgi:CRP/FNR family cyclic AMP-dependent transcriptional regulator
MKTLEPILSEHPFFKGIDSRYLPLIVGCVSNVRFNAGDSIFRAGEEADQFYLIREGKVAVEVHDAESEIPIQTLHKGEILGWSWLIPPYRWRFDAMAVEPVRAFALDGRCLRTKCDADHDLGYMFLKRFAQITAQRLDATRMQLLEVHHAWRVLTEGRS